MSRSLELRGLPTCLPGHSTEKPTFDLHFFYSCEICHDVSRFPRRGGDLYRSKAKNDGSCTFKRSTQGSIKGGMAESFKKIISALPQGLFFGRSLSSHTRENLFSLLSAAFVLFNTLIAICLNKGTIVPIGIKFRGLDLQDFSFLSISPNKTSIMQF